MVDGDLVAGLRPDRRCRDRADEPDLPSPGSRPVAGERGDPVRRGHARRPPARCAAGAGDDMARRRTTGDPRRASVQLVGRGSSAPASTPARWCSASGPASRSAPSTFPPTPNGTSTCSPPSASAWPRRGWASWSSRLALPFRRSQTVRSQIDHHIGLLRRGVRPSTDAVTELCSLLRIGLGSAGMFAIPIVQPSKCERALYLYGHTNEPSGPAAVARGGPRPPHVAPPERSRCGDSAVSTLRELDDELRERRLPSGPGRCRSRRSGSCSS